MKNDPAAEAIKLVDGARQNDYGHPLDDFSKTAMIWSAILSKKLKVDISPEEVGLCMVGVKLSREVNAPKFDNLVDGIGYFRTVQMIYEERERRATSGAEMTKNLLGKMTEAVDNIERAGGPDKVIDDIENATDADKRAKAMEVRHVRVGSEVAPSTTREFANQLAKEELERDAMENHKNKVGAILNQDEPIQSGRTDRT